MQYQQHTPAPPLHAYVDRFWACSDTPRHSRERILPTGTFELVVNLVEDEIRVFDRDDEASIIRYSGAVISGPYERFFAIDPAQHVSFLGIHFKPAGASRFFGFSAAELTSRHITLEELGGSAARSLRDRLCTATTTSARFRILEDFLLRRFVAEPLHPSVRAALATIDHTDHSIREVVRAVGLSHRRFVELFTRAVGLTPKLYSRVQRFQEATHLAANQRRGWSDIAATLGYFDQAHLCRDFVEFSGLTPTAYRQENVAPVLPNHVAR
jgi:AraC-like DNA-binding protein